MVKIYKEWAGLQSRLVKIKISSQIELDHQENWWIITSAQTVLGRQWHRWVLTQRCQGHRLVWLGDGIDNAEFTGDFDLSELTEFWLSKRYGDIAAPDLAVSRRLLLDIST
jgi:hypothetical protein